MILIVFAGLALWVLAKTMEEPEDYGTEGHSGAGRDVGRGGGGSSGQCQNRCRLFDILLAGRHYGRAAYRIHDPAAAALIWL